LQTAKVLAKQGAKHIFLVSRSGKVAYEGQGLEDDLAWLQMESGANVHIVRCDVSEESAVADMLKVARETAGHIDGVVHCAGVIKDGVIRGGAAARGCDDVWSTKAASAWWLHKHTAADQLRLFLLYSSITSAVGNLGQSVYGAANRYLDELAESRREALLPGLSIRWPAVDGVGMAADLLAAGSTSSESYITKDDFAALLSAALPRSAVITILPTAFIPAVHASIAAQFQSVAPKSPPKAQKRQRGAASKRGKASSEATFTLEQVQEIVRSVAKELLNADDSQLKDDTQLMDVGLDSLGATDLAGKLSQRLGLRLLPTLIFNYPTIRDIVSFIASQLDITGDGAERKDVEFVPAAAGGDIAIVGVSCKFPGNINSLADMWEMLIAGKDMMSEASLMRWDSDALISSLDSPEYCKILNRVRYGGFLSDEVIESFRAPLFGISDAEASRMDPGQRLLLEVSYDAFVDAGYTKDQLKGLLAGVFVGAAGMMSESGVTNPNQFLNRGLSVYDATGKALSVAAGRISFALGLQGPSFTTDTACSSSLVALHAAKRSLQNGDCNMAVVKYLVGLRLCVCTLGETNDENSPVVAKCSV
jgi:acyl carrier protein/NADP-dependent 3-hydroxy acid dehydrogenase YdfG